MGINHYLSFRIDSLAAYQLHSSFTVVDMITLNRLQQKVLKHFVSNRAKFSSEKKIRNFYQIMMKRVKFLVNMILIFTLLFIFTIMIS